MELVFLAIKDGGQRHLCCSSKGKDKGEEEENVLPLTMGEAAATKDAAATIDEGSGGCKSLLLILLV